jgi:heat shock protein HspQ
MLYTNKRFEYKGYGVPDTLHWRTIMAKFKVGDKVKVLDKNGWPGGYKIANWEGNITEVKDDPAGYVVMKADKTGYNMTFSENELIKI